MTRNGAHGSSDTCGNGRHASGSPSSVRTPEKYSADSSLDVAIYRPTGRRVERSRSEAQQGPQAFANLGDDLSASLRLEDDPASRGS
jgi:hypothetical protein